MYRGRSRRVPCTVLALLKRSLNPAVTPLAVRVSGEKSHCSMASSVKRIQANGLKFAVSDQGDKGATAVVLLHGFPNNKNMWDRQVGFSLC